jgi:hypothetical protein
MSQKKKRPRIKKKPIKVASSTKPIHYEKEKTT